MSKSIFVVDADTAFTDTLTGSLAARGFSMQVVPDGKEALEQAKTARPDLIVLCVELPKMSGYSVCNKIKKDEDLKAIPVIITSSEATLETFEQHKKLKARAEDYLIKPFDADRLMQCIGQLIGMPSLPANTTGTDEVVAASGDELDFDSLTSSLTDQALPAVSESVPALDIEDPLAALGGEELEAEPPPPPPPPPSPRPAAKPAAAFVAPRSRVDTAAPRPPPDALDNLDSLLSDTARPPAVTPPPVRAPAARASIPPLTDPGMEQALREARRENADLKARIAALEIRLRQADEQAHRVRSDEGSSRAGATSAAKEILALKEQLNAKDKELLAARGEVFSKEKDLLARQEELVELEARAHAADRGKGDLEAQVAALDARAQSVEQQLADADTRVTELQRALLDASNGLVGGVPPGEASSDELIDLRTRLEEAQRNLQTAQEEAQQNEERAMKTYQRLKEDEKLREKLRRTLEIAQQLVSGAAQEDPRHELG
jgi:CheY-like chemotaxis protein